MKISLELEAGEVDALRELAHREKRSTGEQGAFLIAAALHTTRAADVMQWPIPAEADLSHLIQEVWVE